MGTFNGFKKQDWEFFNNIPSEDMPPKQHVLFYQENIATARNIDAEFGSLFKDLYIYLRSNFDSKYEYNVKRLSQGFGKRFNYVWGTFYTSKKIKHQEDIQLFMNFGRFDEEEIPTINIGLSLGNIMDEDRYELYRSFLKSNLKKIKTILEKSKNKYTFHDDEDKLISGDIDQVLTQWVELPGSISLELQEEKEILNSIKLLEKIKSVINDLYPLFHLLIQNEEKLQIK